MAGNPLVEPGWEKRELRVEKGRTVSFWIASGFVADRFDPIFLKQRMNLRGERYVP